MRNILQYPLQNGSTGKTAWQLECLVRFGDSEFIMAHHFMCKGVWMLSDGKEKNGIEDLHVEHELPARQENC